jgi:hypothetical protein
MHHCPGFACSCDDVKTSGAVHTSFIVKLSASRSVTCAPSGSSPVSVFADPLPCKGIPPCASVSDLVDNRIADLNAAVKQVYTKRQLHSDPVIMPMTQRAKNPITASRI